MQTLKNTLSILRGYKPPVDGLNSAIPNFNLILTESGYAPLHDLNLCESFFTTIGEDGISYERCLRWSHFDYEGIITCIKILNDSLSDTTAGLIVVEKEEVTPKYKKGERFDEGQPDTLPENFCNFFVKQPSSRQFSYLYEYNTLKTQVKWSGQLIKLSFKNPTNVVISNGYNYLLIPV